MANKRKQTIYCSKDAALRSARRVLRVACRCLSKADFDEVLLTDGKGLWTVKELLAHMDGVLKLKVRSK